jgi:hypothetical protein
VLLRLDLQDFFPAFPAARAQALFRTLGYPENVADSLGGICTNAVPRDVWNRRPPEIDLVQWRDARTNLAGARQPYRIPLGLTPIGPGQIRKRHLYALRRRSRVLGR